jgi:ankyrin repeat protein
MMEKNFCKQPGMVNFKNSKLFWNIFDVNFQAGANAHSEDDQAPTLNSYASEHEIPIEWLGHFLENALPAFHEGRTSLHMAASNGQVDIVCYICSLEHSRRVNVNIVDKFGHTALHLAAHSQCHGSCNKVITKMLKMTNADPNVVAI